MNHDLMGTVEKLHNRLSDTNYVWFPFLWLKLQPSELLTHRHLAKMTFWFSLYFNLAYQVKKMLYKEQLEFAHAMSNQIAFLVFFFLWFNLVTKAFWNRRARRLSGKF